MGVYFLKDRGTKEQKSSLNVRMFVQASLTYITTFNVEHLRCWEYYSTFVRKNRRSGCIHIFRQKNIRTKDSFKGQMYIQASLVFICLLNVCTCGDCLRLFCLGKNKGGYLLPFVSFKNAVLALQILCMMDMWMFRRKLAYAWTDK